MSDSGLLQAHVRVPGVQGLEIRLQAACFDQALRLQVPEVAKNVLRAGRKSWNASLLAEILPALDLGRVSQPRIGASAGEQEFQRVCAPRKVLG